MKLKLLIAVLANLTFAATSRATIVQGPVTNPANGHTYYLLTQNTWTASEAEAISSLGGHLTTVNDAAENDWIFDTFSAAATGPEFRGLWIGLSDAQSEGAYLWANGDASAFRNWDTGQPTGSPEADYVVLGVNYLGNRNWGDALDDDTRLSAYGVVEVVPEPSSLALFGIGCIGLSRRWPRHRVSIGQYQEWKEGK